MHPTSASTQSISATSFSHTHKPICTSSLTTNVQSSCPGSKRLSSTSRYTRSQPPHHTRRHTYRDLSLTHSFLTQFTAKQLNRQSAKAGKDENAEKAKLKKAIQQNHGDIAKIYAQNAIRKQNEKLNLLRLASRIDAVASRVQTAVTMRQVTGSMANVVKGMDGAMKAMDLEKVSVMLLP